MEQLNLYFEIKKNLLPLSLKSPKIMIALTDQIDEEIKILRKYTLPDFQISKLVKP